jgi:phosphotransferase system HPr (HPr) family protein
MIERNILVNSSLEARLAAIFVQTASEFASSIHLRVDNKVINAKSIMGILSLGVLDGQNITIIADGQDEELAVSKLGGLLGAV